MADKSILEVLRSLNDNLTNGIKKIEGPGGKPQLKKGLSISKTEKVRVFIRVVFLKVGDIDTIKEQYTADLFIQARWREPSLDGQCRNEEKEASNMDQLWNPHLHVDNAIGDLKEDKWYMVGHDANGQAMMHERRRVKGAFFEKMELMEYPFDNQDLTLTMSTQRGETEISLEADDSEISTVNIQSFLDSQEWQLHKHINSWTRVTTNVYHNTKHKHPAVSISCKASRKSNFFMWNIILIMSLLGAMVFTTFSVEVRFVQNRLQLTFILLLSSLTFKFIVTNHVPKISYLTWVVSVYTPNTQPVIMIGSLVFCTFAVDPDLVQNRLQLTFILLLSNITFKFTVSHTIPKVSYLTYMDKYIISSMAILCVVCVWHALIARVYADYGKDTADTADWICLVVLGAIYFALNAGFLVFTQVVVRRRHVQYSRKDLMQKEKMRVMSEQKQEEMMSAKRTQVAPSIGNW